MCNPISRNVIRQSLRWMGAPLPLSVSQPGPAIEAKSGTVMAQINIVFDRAALWYWTHDKALDNNFIAAVEMKNALQECFCGDIVVQPLMYTPNARVQVVTLLCSITAKD